MTDHAQGPSPCSSNPGPGGPVPLPVAGGTPAGETAAPTAASEPRREVAPTAGKEAKKAGGADGEGLRYVALPSTPYRHMIGRRIKHYEVVEELGRGGMGVVYKARDTRLDRWLAIKVLPADKVTDPGRRRRFVQEARAASALNHPHIVVIHDIDQVEGTDFIAMEYVPGRALSDRIPRNGLPLADTLQIAVQIADALTAAHRHGIVHRDLKPSNILVGEDGRTRLVDFGLAKLIEASPSTSTQAPTEDLTAGRTEPGWIVGTAAYMSPEQAQGLAVDARSDLFSFGVVLYEMVTGRRPFQGDTVLSTLAAVLQSDPPALPAKVPEGVRRIILRCLRKDPARRFQDARDLQVELAELQEESETGALKRPPTPRPRHGLPWVVGLGAAVCLGLLTWGILSRRRGEDATSPMPTVALLASNPTREWNPALSHDGRQVAFIWDGPGGDDPDLYVQLIGEGSPRRLTTHPELDFSPAWSPDGLHLAFARASDAGMEVLMIPAAGGEERVLTSSRAQSRWDVVGLATAFAGISWSPDGRHLAFPDRPREGAPQSLFLLDLGTLERRQLTAPPDGWFGDGLSAFSPDGRRVAFQRSQSPYPSDIYVLDLGNLERPADEPRRLTTDNTALAGLAWSQDGRSVLFASWRGGVMELWSIPQSGGQPERVPFGRSGSSWPSVARRAQRLAFTESSYEINIWRLDLSAAALNPDLARSGDPVIRSSHLDVNPSFSPDGRKIAFASRRGGSGEVWIANADGSNPQSVSRLGGGVLAPHWSPDGRQVAFWGTQLGQRIGHVYVISANGGQHRRLTEEPFGGGYPSWSRDGRWIYFTSDHGDGSRIWKSPTEGGPPVAVSREGSRPVESPDGRYLYFDAGRSIRRLSVADGSETQVLDKGPRAMWALSTDRLCVLDPDAAEGPTVSVLDCATGSLLFTVRLGGKAEDYVWGSSRIDVSSDGAWLLYEHRDREDADIVLVDHFTG